MNKYAYVLYKIKINDFTIEFGKECSYGKEKQDSNSFD